MGDVEWCYVMGALESLTSPLLCRQFTDELALRQLFVRLCRLRVTRQRRFQLINDYRAASNSLFARPSRTLLSARIQGLGEGERASGGDGSSTSARLAATILTSA